MGRSGDDLVVNVPVDLVMFCEEVAEYGGSSDGIDLFSEFGGSEDFAGGSGSRDPGVCRVGRGEFCTCGW
jgi:hypothetical protein